MTKVLVNGATAGTNFGDFLFAKMFQDHIANLVGIENVYWYESRYALSDFFTKHLKYSKRYNLRDIDCLVYMSGGYFHGDDKGMKDYIIRYLRYFHIGLKCILRKIPFGVFGVEVGQTPNIILRLVENAIIKKSKIMIVRNRQSEQCVIKMGGG